MRFYSSYEQLKKIFIKNDISFHSSSKPNLGDILCSINESKHRKNRPKKSLKIKHALVITIKPNEGEHKNPCETALKIWLICIIVIIFSVSCSDL